MLRWGSGWTQAACAAVRAWLLVASPDTVRACAEGLVAALLEGTTHVHSRVRLSCIEALNAVVQKVRTLVFLQGFCSSVSASLSFSVSLSPRRLSVCSPHCHLQMGLGRGLVVQTQFGYFGGCVVVSLSLWSGLKHRVLRALTVTCLFLVPSHYVMLLCILVCRGAKVATSCEWALCDD
jgi:hypothetical protein